MTPEQCGHGLCVRFTHRFLVSRGFKEGLIMGDPWSDPLFADGAPLVKVKLYSKVYMVVPVLVRDIEPM